MSVPALPDSKRRRLLTEHDRVKKETFVESMLNQVSDSLASDSAYGYNSANRIRRRVEDIADGMDEDEVAAGGSLTSAGRAVLNARFAMGSDDSHYLSHAVYLLWAGD